MARPLAFSILALAALAHAIPGHNSPKQHNLPKKGFAELLVQPTNKAVIAQMFEWDWDSVAAECTNFLGPAGYGYVQVSPAQEHVEGFEWWTDYQPVSYILTSKRGNEASTRP